MYNLTAEDARVFFNYDAETGVLTWRSVTCRRMKPGDIAGRPNRRGYWQTNVLGRKYSNHRIAWLIFHGEWPANQIDHINRNPADNRICNLRDVTLLENMKNRAMPFGGTYSRLRGVSYHKQCGKWQAQAWVGGKVKYLGLFNSEQEAADVVRRAA